MKKSQLKRIIREEVRRLDEKKDYARGTFDYKVLSRAGISNKDIEYMEDIYNDIANKVGDSGTCVLGNGIMIDGKLAISSYAQGSLGLEHIQKKLIPFLRENYPDLKIRYAWGNMD